MPAPFWAGGNQGGSPDESLIPNLNLYFQDSNSNIEYFFSLGLF